MARGINKVTLVGRVGSIESKAIPSGTTVTNLSLATDESYKDKNTGQVVTQTEWHRVVFFGKVAEIAQQIVNKGDLIYLEGRLKTRKWQDQQGQDRYTTEIVVDMNGELQQLTPKGQGNGQASAPAAAPQQPAQQPAAPAGHPEPTEDFSDDIPF